MKLPRLLLPTLILCAFSSQAEYVKTDWQDEGDALATLDTTTGLEWLSLSQASRNSVNDIKGMFDDGDKFEGWRLATASEVTELMGNLYPTLSGNGEPLHKISTAYGELPDDAFSDLYDPFISVFGWAHIETAETRDIYRAYGLYEDGDTIRQFGVYHIDPKANNMDETAQLYTGYSASHVTYDISNLHYAPLLVSDGGTTLSSILDPSLNARNPASPINQEEQNISDVPVTLGWGVLALGLASLRRRFILARQS